ncbi:MAG: stalk domain-containing protein [Caldisericia bacterium]
MSSENISDYAWLVMNRGESPKENTVGLRIEKSYFIGSGDSFNPGKVHCTKISINNNSGKELNFILTDSDVPNGWKTGFSEEEMFDFKKITSIKSDPNSYTTSAEILYMVKIPRNADFPDKPIKIHIRTVGFERTFEINLINREGAYTTLPGLDDLEIKFDEPTCVGIGVTGTRHYYGSTKVKVNVKPSVTWLRVNIDPNLVFCLFGATVYTFADVKGIGGSNYEPSEVEIVFKAQRKSEDFSIPIDWTFQNPTEQITFQIGSNQCKIEGGDTIEMDCKPTVLQNRTYLPARYVCEPFEGGVLWDETEKKVICILGGTVVEFWIGKPIARVNGKDAQIDPNNPDIVPMIIDDRTMVPMRFLAESLGCEVEWVADSKEIILTYDP